MTLIIENVKKEFLPAFRGLSKSAKAKLKMKKNAEDEPTKETIKALKSTQSVGIFNDFNDFKKALEN